MPENKVFFIVNKYSGTGFQDSIEGRIIDACAKFSLEAIIEYTKSKGHATELARDAVGEGYSRIFALGGDGTVNEVAKGVANTFATMGIIPGGSGNGLARHLHIPLEIEDALKLLGRHSVINMDTLYINNHISVNVSGIGFDGHVAGQFGKDGKRGLIGYGKLVLREFMSFKEFPVELQLDGQPIKRTAFILALANSSQFGNNAKISPFASVCDQLIDVCFIRKVPITHAIGFAQKMFSGHMDRSAFVETMQGKKIMIEFKEPMPYHIDGEAMEPASKFDIRISPGSLKMVVPDEPGLKP
ncbi:diacylglycerol kinase family lipid kinase [soil metagenome]